MTPVSLYRGVTIATFQSRSQLFAMCFLISSIISPPKFSKYKTKTSVRRQMNWTWNIYFIEVNLFIKTYVTIKEYMLQQGTNMHHITNMWSAGIFRFYSYGSWQADVRAVLTQQSVTGNTIYSLCAHHSVDKTFISMLISHLIRHSLSKCMFMLIHMMEAQTPAQPPASRHNSNISIGPMHTHPITELNTSSDKSRKSSKNIP